MPLTRRREAGPESRGAWARPIAVVTVLAFSAPVWANEAATPVPSPEAVAPAPAPSPTPGKLADEDTGGPYLAWGVTVAFGASALIFGLMALSANGSLDDKKGEVTTADELTSTRDRMLGFAVATDVMLLGTLVAGSVATYLTVVAATPHDEDEASLHLRLGLTPAGLGLQGTF